MKQDEMDRLLEIMAHLRGPGGCPWDREQTPRSLRTYVIEEAFELAEAIDGGDWESLREELGDLLLQVVFLSRIAEEQERFCFTDVVSGLCEKLVRRHPHVFGTASAEDSEAVWKQWEEIKLQEKERPDSTDTPSRLAGLPKSLPSLVSAHRLAEKAARAGFDWPDPAGVLDKIVEESREVRRAADGSGGQREIEAEVGDLLFAAASLARHLGVDPEAALAGANRKFIRRFQHVEGSAARRGVELEDLSPQELDILWREAKEATREGDS